MFLNSLGGDSLILDARSGPGMTWRAGVRGWLGCEGWVGKKIVERTCCLLHFLNYYFRGLALVLDSRADINDFVDIFRKFIANRVCLVGCQILPAVEILNQDSIV